MVIPSKHGFTRLEAMITASFLLLIAVVVVPQFSQATEDNRAQELASRLDLVRTQLQIYSMHHAGKFPTAFVAQMTGRTDREGNVMSDNDDPLDYSFGPYLDNIPFNPFVSDSARARSIGVVGENVDRCAWVYDPQSGHFAAGKKDSE